MNGPLLPGESAQLVRRIPTKPPTMATLPFEPIKIATTSGTRTVPVKWRGRALAVHKPLGADGEPSTNTRGWRISHHGSGLSAGHLNGTLKDALKLAKLWDNAFYAALLGCHHNDSRNGYETANRPHLRDWPLRHHWGAIIRGETPIAAPNVKYAPPEPGPIAQIENASCYGDLERAVWRAMGYEPASDADAEEQYPAHETVAADLLRDSSDGVEMFWRGRWYLVPTLGEIESFCLGSVAETPDGRTVEPDASESWPRLLGLI